MRHHIEAVVLWAMTLTYLWIGLITALATWAERPQVGRDEHGTAVARRQVRR